MNVRLIFLCRTLLRTVSHRLQVESLIEAANNLLPSYAADKERLICDRRDEVIHAWRQLQCSTEQRKVHLLDAADVHRFFAMVRELRMWMEIMRTEMATKEKPRLVLCAISNELD